MFEIVFAIGTPPHQVWSERIRTRGVANANSLLFSASEKFARISRNFVDFSAP